MNIATEFDYLFKLVIVGDSCVGKSSILERFLDDRFDDREIHTIGVDFGSKIISINNKKVKLQMWDTAGQERFKSISVAYYRGAAGIILVYDTTNYDSFLHIKGWFNSIQSISPTACTMLIGNKTDRDTEKNVPFEEADAFAKQHGMLFMETSSATGYNVDNMFLTLADEIFKKSIVTEKGTRLDIIALKEETSVKGQYGYQGCC